MARFLSNEDFHSQGVIQQLNTITDQTNYLKKEYCFDSRANEYFDWILKKVNRVKILTEKDPRYNWQILQHDMDVMYKRSGGLISGYNIIIDLAPESPYQRCMQKYNISDLKL